MCLFGAGLDHYVFMRQNHTPTQPVFQTIIRSENFITAQNRQTDPLNIGKMSFKKPRASGTEKSLSPKEQQAKINEIRKLIGPIADKLPSFCSDDSLSRYLRAKNWNSKRAAKMLKETLKWRMEYKPENIRWDDVADEAKIGKAYRASYLDKQGRTVLIMRPGCQNSSSTRLQIKYLVYCMENAIMNLAPNQEQMVWLIDFQGWNTSSISVKVTRETAHVLQERYPERLGLAILYDPPKIFESFWTMVKPFLDSKTSKKVQFVYSQDPESQKIMESLFDMDKLESVFGGRNPKGFDFQEYRERMKEDDKKMSEFIISGCSTSSQSSIVSLLRQTESLSLDHNSEVSDALSSSSEEGAPLNLEGGNDSAEDNTESRLGCNEGAKSVTDFQNDVLQMKQQPAISEQKLTTKYVMSDSDVS